MVTREFIRWYREQPIEVRFELCKIKAKELRENHYHLGLFILTVIFTLMVMAIIFALWSIL